MTGLLLTVLLGALAGWLASKIMNRDAEMNWLWNIGAGILGAVLANLLLAPLLGREAVLDRVTLEGFLMALLGAVIVVGLLNLATRKRLR